MMKTLAEHEELASTPRGAADEDDNYNEEEIEPTGCFYFNCFGRRRRRGATLLPHKEGENSNCLLDKAKKIKEISELAAGPKWKTFLGKFSYENYKKRNRRDFQYDPQSYALNFDDYYGDDGDDDDDANAPQLSFSARFAPVNASHDFVPTQLNKSS